MEEHARRVTRASVARRALVSPFRPALTVIAVVFSRRPAVESGDVLLLSENRVRDASDDASGKHMIECSRTGVVSRVVNVATGIVELRPMPSPETALGSQSQAGIATTSFRGRRAERLGSSWLVSAATGFGRRGMNE
jgi:hypothetical protein